MTKLLVSIKRAGLALVAGAVTLPALAQTAPLTLQDLLVSAINNNLELRAKRLDPEAQRYRLAAAWGDFDPAFVAGSYVLSSEHPQNYRDFLATGSSITIYQEEIIHYEAGFTGKLPTGANYSLNTFVERNDNSINRKAPVFNGNLTNPSVSGPGFHPEYAATAVFSLTQPLLRDFGLNANLAEVRLNKSALATSEQETRGTLLRIMANVVGAYYEMVFGQENIRVKEQAVELAQNLVRDNKRRLDEGKMSPLDVTQAQGRLAEAREELLLAQNFLAQRRNTLRELTRENFDSEDGDWTVDNTFLRRDLPELDRNRLLPAMFENNPVYLANVEAARASDIRLTYAKNQRWPRVDLKASLSYNGLAGDWSPAYTDFDQRTGPDWNVGFVVNIPLTNRVGRARYSEAKTRKMQALITVKRTEVQLLSAFDSAMRDLASARERMKLVRDSVTLADSALTAEEKRLASGVTTSYNVATAQRDMSQAHSRELATLVDLNKAYAQLYALVGTLPQQLKVDVKSE
ncbi:TolC family protein [Horticoccus luteus]|uniref:TolC family protein n=1 Tax=Horticoccus luteus TaxID=2862869 RepID=A0A8F9TTT1_9BACT|nr:TolC family protein [Horticoccus luteus]QYM78931.1 TolC family protein [Horticoccus luteus]